MSPRLPLWDYFDEQGKKNKCHKFARCKACAQDVAGVRSSMAAHLRACERLDADTRSKAAATLVELGERLGSLGESYQGPSQHALVEGGSADAKPPAKRAKKGKGKGKSSVQPLPVEGDNPAAW